LEPGAYGNDVGLAGWYVIYKEVGGGPGGI
jgi:hypothetical protein